MLNVHCSHHMIGGNLIMDIKTIDEMTEFSFKDDTSKKRWIHLVETQYFDNYNMHITMDFVRRWGKAMQYQMKNNQASLNNIAILCAKEADIDKLVKQPHLEKAITLLSETWFYCNEFQKWVANGGSAIIKQYF